ncbi:xanthine dehydrogenase accessory protein XdhC [Ideonella dechloratans]|uniref:Xanthine dehydrogenase accessory protein XdhC n=1 Tax=Ideonella dechloratans TaxID=36863 RepID=A0A643FH64_IDEDE|nr:xanthine dehydrogenase accessory protein XdhC [Ideonella dechloratans]KAB0585362.1 xanthine dehydrogenase accessory protein XdhC [Ideonella dechloratans]UFU09305.1 xanthine dehydrogenase accessory protein XdhC [Ideonella dechloratans]
MTTHDTRDPDATAARTALAGGRPTLLVEVVAARGSVPRGLGTRMLVGADGVRGTIGGGHLEWQVLQRARELLARDGTPATEWPLDWPVALGPSLGQCCGGALTLRFSPLDAATMAAWTDPPVRLRLQLHGAGHVGRAIVRLLADLPCQVLWVDERDKEFPSEPSPPHIERLVSEAPEAEVGLGRPGDAYLVLTHRHDLDLRIVEAILRRGDFGFCGLIGSATKRARFEHRLRERGIPASTLSRLTSPIGLPGLTGKEPAVIALSVVAQLLQRTSG